MPNPWKRSSRTSSFSRLVSAFRPKRPSPDSPLLVQTGFPTSLADLVVKHRSRLRKKKDNHNHDHSHKPHPHAPPPSRFGSRVSEIISVVEDFSSTLNENDHDGDGDHDELSSTQGGSTHKADASSSAEIIAEEDATRPGEEERSDLGARSGGAVPASVITTPGRGLGCQAKVVLVMALAVSTRELVLGVMLSAFSLLLLESLGARALAWARRRGERRRELEPPQTLGSEKREIPDSGFDPRSAVSPERSNLGKVGSWKGDEVAVKAKRRRWAEAMKEKLRPSTRGKDAKEAGSDAGGGGGGGGGVEEGGGELEEEEEAVKEGEEEEGGGVDEACGVEKKYNSNGRSRHLHHNHVLLLVVVLSGLVRGKVVALVITVASCYLMKMAGFVASNRRRTRRIPTSCSVA